MQFLLNEEKVKGKKRYTKINQKIIYVQDINTNLINEKKSENKLNNLNYDILSDSITIIYKINEKDSKIKIFGYDFVESNKENCYILYKNEKYNLYEYLTGKFNLNVTLMIKLVGINNIKNISFMFHKCSSLLSLPDILRLELINKYDMHSIFANCTSLINIDNNISKWNTSNIISMNWIFSNFILFKVFPDISKFNTNKIVDFAGLFCDCSSLIFFLNK